jgi:hypothetical protein
MGFTEILTDSLNTSFVPRMSGPDEFVGFNPLVQKPIGLRFHMREGVEAPDGLTLLLDGQEHYAPRATGDIESHS